MSNKEEIGNGKFYFINIRGERSKNIYEVIEKTINGFTAVKRNGLWGYVNSEGREVIPCTFASVGNFNGGYAKVEKNGFTGLIAGNGKFILRPIYEFIGEFSDGVCEVVKDGKVGYIDENFIFIIPCIYQSNNIMDILKIHPEYINKLPSKYFSKVDAVKLNENLKKEAKKAILSGIVKEEDKKNVYKAYLDMAKDIKNHMKSYDGELEESILDVEKEIVVIEDEEKAKERQEKEKQEKENVGINEVAKN